MPASAALPALVLGAGRGERFAAAGGSGPKILVPLHGRPVLAHVIARATDAGCTPIHVVLSADVAAAPPVQELLARPSHPVQAVINPRPERGLGTSLAVGLRALAASPADACVVLLGDQPGVDPSVITRAMARWHATGRAVRARYQDGEAHPIVLPRALWPELLEPPDTAPSGARDLLAATDVAIIDVAGPIPVDIDVPADLDRLGP